MEMLRFCLPIFLSYILSSRLCCDEKSIFTIRFARTISLLYYYYSAAHNFVTIAQTCAQWKTKPTN